MATNHYGGHFLARFQLLLEELKALQSPVTPAVDVAGERHRPNSKEAGWQDPHPCNAGSRANLVRVSNRDSKPDRPWPSASPSNWQGYEGQAKPFCNMIITQELATVASWKQRNRVQFPQSRLRGRTPTIPQHYPLFQKIFPGFQRNVTGGYVSQELAGRVRPGWWPNRLRRSPGPTWSWGKPPKAQGGKQFCSVSSQKRPATRGIASFGTLGSLDAIGVGSWN